MRSSQTPLPPPQGPPEPGLDGWSQSPGATVDCWTPPTPADPPGSMWDAMCWSVLKSDTCCLRRPGPAEMSSAWTFLCARSQTLNGNLLKVVILNKLLELLDVVNRGQILLDVWQSHQVVYKRAGGERRRDQSADRKLSCFQQHNSVLAVRPLL